MAKKRSKLNNLKQPSFLKKKFSEGKKEKQDSDSGQQSFDEKSQKSEMQQKSKREEKQENKDRIKESRSQGLPTGITSSDVQKFNDLLKKHGDNKQNEKYFQKFENINQENQQIIIEDNYQIPKLEKINLQDQNALSDTKLMKCLIYKGQSIQKCLTVEKEIKEQNIPRIDFNNENDFNPDTNINKLAQKCWDWLLYPVGYNQFFQIINSAKQGGDQDLQSQETYRFIHIKDRQANWYEQNDSMDNLLSIQMIKDYFINQMESQNPVYLDDDLEIFQYMNGHRINLMPFQEKKELQEKSMDKSKIELKQNIFKCLIENKGVQIIIKNPQVFNASLRKLISLSDELMCQDFISFGHIINPDEQLSIQVTYSYEENKKQFESFLFVLENECKIVVIFQNGQNIQIDIKQGDFLYLPSNASYFFIQNGLQQSKSCLVLLIHPPKLQDLSSNSAINLFQNILKKYIQSASLQQDFPIFRQSIPKEHLFCKYLTGNEKDQKDFKAKEYFKNIMSQFQTMVFKEQNDTNLFKDCIDIYKIEFLKRRMPVSEAMQPNEIQEDSPSEQGNAIPEPAEESLEDEISEQNIQAQVQINEMTEKDDEQIIDQFQSIKASSQNSFFLKQEIDLSINLYYSNQNSALKGEITEEFQKIKIESKNLAKAIQLIQDSYPEYLDVNKGQLSKLIQEDGVAKHLLDLAIKQIFVVI